MIIINCANGVVAWLLHRPTAQTAEAICVADNTKVSLSPTADSTWVTAMQAIGTHSVALKGAIQHITYIPRVI